MDKVTGIESSRMCCTTMMDELILSAAVQRDVMVEMSRARDTIEVIRLWDTFVRCDRSVQSRVNSSRG